MHGGQYVVEDDEQAKENGYHYAIYSVKIILKIITIITKYSYYII